MQNARNLVFGKHSKIIFKMRKIPQVGCTLIWRVERPVDLALQRTDLDLFIFVIFLMFFTLIVFILV